MKLSSRMLVLVFGLAILVVLAGGVWFYIAQEQSLQRRVETEIQTVGQFKVDQIVSWRAERLEDAYQLTDNAFIVEAIGRWMAAPQAKDTELILSQFRSLQDHLHYADVQLVDASGQIRLSLSGESGALHAETMPTLVQVWRDRQPALTDFHISPSDLSTHVSTLLCPILRRKLA
ncbi:MAG: hypothetical protein Q7O66_18400 [Dehalococcoidia bacterium]|nr:hypothetical protein [Dehalococcoidia bacterium]